MEGNHTNNRWAGIVGLSGAIGILVIMALMGDTFGLPGTAAYQRYQTYNRLMSVGLLLASFAFIGFYVRLRASLPRAGKVAFLLTIVGCAGMVLGNAVEFWLFTDLSYNDPNNMRSISFSVFSFASLLLDIGSLVGGIALLRSATIPRWLSVVLIAHLPLDILSFILGSIFLATGLVSLILAVFLTTGSQGRPPVTVQKV